MTRRNQAIIRFLLPVAALWAFYSPGRAQVNLSAQAAGGQISPAGRTIGCLQFNSKHVCISGEITKSAAEAKAILEGGRYTAEGSGPPLYVHMAQTCPWSQAFFKDRAKLQGVQFRYYPVIRSTRDPSVQTLMSRSLPDLVSYMNNTLRPPSAGFGPVTDSFLNDLGYGDRLLEKIMTENGLRPQDFQTPVFYWIGGGKVFLASGFGRSEYETALIESVKSAAAGSQENAGSPAAGAITAGAPEVKTLLEGGRYTADGSGPPLYAWVSQTSSAAKEFFKDRAQFSGVQFRYYPLPSTKDSSDQIVQAMESRSVPDFVSYMNQTLHAPSFRQDNARIDILNSLINGTTRLNAILTRNGGANLFQVSPYWFWLVGDKVYWTVGYNPEYLAQIVASVRSSSVGAPQPVQPVPPPAPSSPVNPAARRKSEEKRPL